MNPGRGVEKLMYRGLMGDLIRGPGFANLRATQADLFVFFSYAVVFVVSLILALTTSSFAVTIVLYGLWTALGFVFIALGTKLSHHFATWGIALVAALMSLGRVWGSIVRLAADEAVNQLTGERADNPGIVAVQLILFIAAVAAYGYLTFEMARFVTRMSGSRGPSPAPFVAPGFPVPSAPFEAPNQYSPMAPPSAPLRSPTPPPPTPLALTKTQQTTPALPGSPADDPTHMMAKPPMPVASAAPRPPAQPLNPFVQNSPARQHEPLQPPQPQHAMDNVYGSPRTGSIPSPYGWQSQAPFTRPPNPVLAIIASAACLVPAIAVYWLQQLIVQQWYVDKWVFIILWTFPSALFAAAVLIRARRGRRTAATLVAVLTLAIAATINALWLYTDLPSAAWMYSLIGAQTLGATLAWGIARRTGAVWLVAVPVSTALGCLGVWLVWETGPAAGWFWSHSDGWWSVMLIELPPVLLGILFAWLLNVTTRGVRRHPPGHYGGLPAPGHQGVYGQFHT